MNDPKETKDPLRSCANDCNLRTPVSEARSAASSPSDTAATRARLLVDASKRYRAHTEQSIQQRFRVVRLNVGGVLFSTSANTLSAVPDSVLSLVAQSDWDRRCVGPSTVIDPVRGAPGEQGQLVETEVDEEAPFIDRSPQPFEIILRYLRKVVEVGDNAALEYLAKCVLCFLSPSDIHELSSEANYYCLSNLEAFTADYRIRRWVECGTFFQTETQRLSGGMVLCMEYHELYGTVTVGLADGSIRIFHAASLAPQVELHVHTDYVTCIAVTAALIITGSRDRTIAVLANGYQSSRRQYPLLATLRGHMDFVQALRLSENGDRVFSGGYDRTVRVWTLTELSSMAVKILVASESTSTINASMNMNPEVTLKVSAPVRALALFLGCYLLVACGSSVDVINLTAGTVRESVVKGHSACVRAMDVETNRGVLATGAWDGEVRLWALDVPVVPSGDNGPGVQTAAPLSVSLLAVVAQCEDWIAHVCFVGNLLAASCKELVYFFAWDMMTPGEGRSPLVGAVVIRQLRTNHTNVVRGFICIPEHNCIISGSFDAAVSRYTNTFLGGRTLLAHSHLSCSSSGYRTPLE